LKISRRALGDPFARRKDKWERGITDEEMVRSLLSKLPAFEGAKTARSDDVLG
jgi:hypothetical protein